MAAAGRESILKEAIGRNPGISKTDLLERVKDDMAKPTASKALGYLVKSGEVIEMNEGKKVRHYLRDAEEEGLGEDLTAALDGYVEDLRSMKDGVEAYPYDLLNAFNNEIRRQRDNLSRLKKRLEDELKFEHAVEDVMREYGEMRGDVVESLSTLRGLVDYGTERRIHECLEAMSGRLMEKAKKQFELRTKRKSHGKGEKRDSLTEEIKQLGSDIDKILDLMLDLRHDLEYLSPKSHEWRGPPAPQTVGWLRHVEKGRAGFQRLVEEALNAKDEMRGDGPEHWPDAEAGLTRIVEQLSDMKDVLAETEEAVVKSYMDADRYKRLKELSSLVDETLEAYRP